MTREEAKELLPIIQAFAEGKEIEFRSKGFDEEWRKVNEIPGLSYSSFDYRIKPEPRCRPFKDGRRVLAGDAETSAVRMDKENLWTL